MAPRAAAPLLAAVLLLAAGVPAASARSLLQQTPRRGSGGSGTSPPTPAASFPLNGSLASDGPGSVPEGSTRNVLWEEDPSLGVVMSCDERRQAYAAIPGLSYGQGGDGFALAFWARPQVDNGASYDYLVSHVNARASEPGFDPNEVSVFLPEANNDNSGGSGGAGFVRAIVRDRSDVRTNGSTPFYLDSSGCVAGDPACTEQPAVDLAAGGGSWHHIAVTTHPGARRGYQLWVDGELAGDATDDQLYQGADGYPKAATGGGAMNLTGPLTLCARWDLEPSRFYTGSLARLHVFNRSLDGDEVAALYEAERPSSPGTLRATETAGTSQPRSSQAASTGPAAAAATADDYQPAADCSSACEQWSDTLWICYTPSEDIRQCSRSSSATPGSGSSSTPRASSLADDASATAGGSSSGSDSFSGDSELASTMDAAVSSLSDPPAAPGNSSRQAVAQLGGQPLCSDGPIEGISTVTSCAEGYVCAPLSAQRLASVLGGAFPTGVGVCAFAPLGLMLPPSADVPPPMAFFPLNSQTLQSFPDADYGGTAAGAGIVPDDLFGSALSCSAEDKDLVALDPVPYGASTGAFTLNLWFRPGNMSAPGLSYLLSHRAKAGALDIQGSELAGWGPNQIQVYLPNVDHPAAGVLRTYVKDSTDTAATMGAATWLDSDGSIALSGQRDIPPALELNDGAWHMVTVASQPAPEKGAPSHPRGYRLFLDGSLVNQVMENNTYYSPEGYLIPVDGGDPLRLDGDLVLCSRSDDPAGRHYDGRLAYLSLWDTALDDVQIGQLYTAVADRMQSLPPQSAEARPSSLAADTELPVLAPAASGGSATQRSASGQPCQFPALLNGEAVTECVPLDASGVPSCQVDEGVWEACEGAVPLLPSSNATAADSSPFAAAAAAYPQSAGSAGSGAGSAAAQAQAAPAARYTVGGAECVFPAQYGGRTVYDCVSQGPGTAGMCMTASGVWADCAPAPGQQDPTTAVLAPAAASAASPIYPTAGAGEPVDATASSSNSSVAPIVTDRSSACQLPLDYEGVQVDGCVKLDSALMCWAATEQAWVACPDSLLRTEPKAAELGLEPAAALVPVVPVRQRSTTDGHTCRLPVVTEGEILDDCVPRDGTWSCLTLMGQWAECALTEPPSSADGRLLVAQRTTAGGDPCLLPAVFRGRLFFDCVHNADSSGTVEICPTPSAGWDRCSSAGLLGMSLADPQPVSAPAALNRTAPGREGMLCPVPPSPQPAQNCAQGLTCAPLPDLTTNGSTSSGLEGLGFCAPEPAGGTFGSLQYLQSAGAPTPLAYFPLTGRSLASLLLPAYNGSASGMPLPGWVGDSTFEAVLACDRDARNAAVLPTVPYAANANGSFAIALWMRRLPGSGTSGQYFQYLYSHTGVKTASPQSPNQVAIYLPDRGHPAYGTVRVIVTDANDQDAELTYLDSDGSVQSAGRGRAPRHADVNDGGWHMLAVSTHPNDTRGYVLYVDGREVAALGPLSRTAGGEPADVTGGDPARLSGDIYLCSRQDSDPQRFYSGSVAHLMLFNQALQPSTVAGLYSTFLSANASKAGGPLLAAAAGPVAPTDPSTAYMAASPPSSSSGGLSGGEIAAITVVSVGAALSLAALGALFVVHRRRQRGQSFERYSDEAALQAAEAHLPRSHGSGGLAAGALPAAAAGAAAAPLSIQLSSGKSLSMSPTDLDSQAGSTPPRTHSQLSDVSEVIPTPTAAAAGAPRPMHTRSAAEAGGRGGAPTVTTLPRNLTAPTTRPSASLAGSEAGGSEAGGLTIEPGKRGLFRTEGARVVLGPDGGQAVPDPRGPLEP